MHRFADSTKITKLQYYEGNILMSYVLVKVPL